MGKELPLGVKLVSTYIVVGDSTRKWKEWFDSLRAEMEGRDGAPPLINRFAPAEGGIREVASALQTRPLFGGRALVVVEDGESFIKGEGEGWLIRRLDEGGEGVLVVMLGSLDRRGALFKCAVKKGALVDVSQPTEGALVSALKRHAAKLGIRIDANALRLLLSCTGEHFDSAAAELDKLALLGKERITERDVEELVVDVAESGEYALSNALERLDAADALETIERAWRNGIRLLRRNQTLTKPEEITLYFMNQALLSLLRLRAVYRLKRSGVGDDEVAKRLRLSGWAKEKVLPRMKRSALELGDRIDEALIRLAETDAAIKKGADPRFLLESFICWLLLPR